MKIILTTLALCLSFALPAVAEVGDWEIHAAYHNHTKAVKLGSTIYVLSDGSLFSYDTEDTSVETYDKASHLNDFGIYDIAECPDVKAVVILYNNGNVDILYDNGDVVNMPELKQKALKDKTLNELKVSGSEAFVSTGSGVVVVNLNECYFEGLYNWGYPVSSTIVEDGAVYARTADGIFKGLSKTNLLDPESWSLTTDHIADDFDAARKVIDDASTELLATVKDIHPDGPIRNYSWHLQMAGERLLVAGGAFLYDGTEPRQGTAMQYENGKWTIFDEDGPGAARPKVKYNDVVDLVQDPKDPTHHWASTIGSGLNEFRDYKLVNSYSMDNSPLTSILPNVNDKFLYVRLTALQYDPDGNLWLCNTECDTIIRILKNDGKWTSIYIPEIKGFSAFDHTMFDQRGWAWIQSRRYLGWLGHTAGLLVYDTKGDLENRSNDRYKLISTFHNQDGVSYTPMEAYCMKEDLDGNIWYGCDAGLFVTYEPEKVFDDNFYFTQVKINRGDDSGLADYLLSNAAVSAIAVDAANRKWIGTMRDGVYLISADGQETLHHFTTENSPLLSNIIDDIAVNGETGQVFFATRAGLCSYASDAINSIEPLEGNNIRIYPNPLRPEDRSNVHITGLAHDTEVKIVDAAGKLVYSGTSLGGQFIWNCQTNSGHDAVSGVYFVLATDSEGKKGASAKFLIIR